MKNLEAKITENSLFSLYSVVLIVGFAVWIARVSERVETLQKYVDAREQTRAEYLAWRTTVEVRLQQCEFNQRSKR